MNLNNSIESISQIISDPKIPELQQIGLIDEIALRNYKIKLEYHKLRKTKPIMDAMFDLSEKYNLSFDTINTILFRPRNKKPLN